MRSQNLVMKYYLEHLICRFLKRITLIQKNCGLFLLLFFLSIEFFNVVIYFNFDSKSVFSLIVCSSSFTVPSFEYFHLVLICLCHSLHPKVACAFHKTFVIPQSTTTFQSQWFSPAPPGWEFVRPHSPSSWLMQITSVWEPTVVQLIKIGT